MATSQTYTKNSQDSQKQAFLTKTAMTNKNSLFPIEGTRAHMQSKTMLQGFFFVAHVDQRFASDAMTIGSCRSGFSAVSARQETNSGKFRLFPANSAFFPAISAFSFRLSWLGFRLACFLSLQIQAFCLWLQAFVASTSKNPQNT